MLRSNLRACVIDGFLYCVMVGVAEQYFPYFVLKLHLGEIASGLIATVPLFIASLLQLFTPWLVRRYRSYRAITSRGAALQAAALVPLAMIAAAAQWWIPAHRELIESMNERGPPGVLLFAVEWAPTTVLFLITTLYFAGATVGGPAWSALVGAMIPKRIQARYFGMRNFVLGVGLLAGLVAGSQLLAAAGDYAPDRQVLGLSPTFLVFSLLFLVAAVARAASAWYLTRYVEPVPERLPLPVHVPPAHFVDRLRRTHHGRALVFLLLVQAAHLLAFPYFNPYLKEHLRFDDVTYGLFLAAFFLGKLVAPAPVGRAVHRFGVHRVVIAAAAAMAPVPLLLMLDHSTWWLMIAQFISGASFSAFELCAFLVQLEHVRAIERTSVLSQFGALYNTAGLLGSIAGGAVLDRLGTGARGYAVLFTAAAIARVVALAAFPRGRGVPPEDIPAASGEPVLSAAPERLTPR